MLIALLCALAPSSLRAADWEQSLGQFAPGNFPEPRPVRVQYAFGWNGATVASAQLRFHRVDERFVLEGTAETVGLARGLWQFNAEQSSSTDAHTLRPLQVREVEKRRRKQFETDISFTPERATSHRVEQKDGQTKTSDKSFDFPNVASLSSALLYFRSKPLTDGAVERLVVYPGRTPYLCTLTVLGRDRITVPAGAFDAIKCDVKLSKIGDDHELKPHKKFKRATVWLSNDADRLLLRIEAQVFIGSVFAELQSAQFERAKP